MMERVRVIYVYAMVIGLAALLMTLPMAVPAVTSDEDFSIYNTSWNGCSSLAVKSYRFGGLKPTFTVRGTTSSLEIVQLPPKEWDLDPGRDVLIVIGPNRPFTDADGKAISEFLEGGGILFLADDFGEGNSLLSRLNTSTRFSGRLALDLSFSKKGEFMMVSDVRPSVITDNVSFLLLNYPSTLMPSPHASVVAYSSPTSWLEVERNEKMDPGEARGPFPLIAIERVGRGILITLSDPSLLINQMIEKADNSIFVHNLMEYLTGGGRRVLFDEYHRQYSSPLTFSSTLATALSPGGGTLLPALLLLLGAAYVGRVHIKGMELIGKILERFIRGGEEEPREQVDPLQDLSGDERTEAEEILQELESLSPPDNEEEKVKQ